MKVLVVGGGPAGIAAALQARQLGAEATVLEADRIGGTSLNRGPAPVRTLARTARFVRDWSSWASFGLEGPRPVPNLAAILANSHRVARHAHDKMEIARQIREGGVDLVEQLGLARFAGPHTLRTSDGRTWEGDRIVIAVGGYAAPLRIPGGDLALTYNDIPHLKSLPTEVAVIGGADTGCQIASIFADFACKVWLFEAGPALIPTSDASISSALGEAFSDKGMELVTGAQVQALKSTGDRVGVHFDRGGRGEEATFDSVFAAVGWPANLESLGLDAAGVDFTPQAIPVDPYLQTNVEHIFAAGDVNGRSKLVQSARLEGRSAAWNAVRGPTLTVGHEVVPSGSFTDPEYGAVGMTEAQAAAGHDIVVGKANYEQLLRPVADGRPEGFCKLIVDRRAHTVLGAHVLGEYAAETVQVVAVAMSTAMTVEKLAEMQFAFPTVTEGVAMAARMACRELGVGEFPTMWSQLGHGR
jgi:pyruvate/2-oxoglutarate dehydrogenase complex dihydrolipoamide dehydrogenase (E3) component